MYQVILPRRIQRQLDNKFTDYARRILTQRFLELESNPFGGNGQRVRGYERLWKIRTTANTIYYEVHEQTLRVVIMAIVPNKTD